MILPRTFMHVCVWVYSMYVSPCPWISTCPAISVCQRNCAPASQSLAVTRWAVPCADSRAAHRCPSLQLRRVSMTTSDRWGTPAASTAQASTSPRCGTDRWCSRPPSLQCQLGWLWFQRSNLDLSHGEKEEILRKEEWVRAHRSLFWRECQSDSKGVSKAEQTCGCFSRACTDGLVFVTLKLFCSFFVSFFLSNSPSHTPILSLGCFAF